MKTLDLLLLNHPPHHIALVDQDRKITYGELNQLSDEWSARLIQYHQVQTHDRVAIKMPKSWRVVVALLAIIKARCSYIIMDPKISDDRQNQIIENAGVKLIIEEFPSITSSNFNLPKVEVSDECYCYFTSGSSGIPKAACFDHQRAMTFILWAQNYFKLKEHDNIACVSPLTFDICLFDIFVTLFAGATVVLVPDPIKLFRKSLIEYLVQQNVSIMQLVPTLWEMIGDASLPHLKKIIFTGQAFNPKQFDLLKSHKEVDCYNLYGQTEANSYLCYQFKYQESEYPLPIAKIPLPSYVEIREEVLWIKNHTLMKNYLGQSIIHEYCTGDLVVIKENKLFLNGRVDNLIKYKGFRISPEEIEATLNTVVEASIVFLNPHQEKLIAVIKTSLEDWEAVLKKLCLKHLATYQIPGKFIRVDKLPENNNGKINRKKVIDSFS